MLELNDDGNPDIAATLIDDGSLAVLYGSGNNQFSKPQIIDLGDQPTRVITADADLDGRLDLLVSNSGDNTASVIYNRFDPNEVYRYDADAIDPDNDPLTYAIDNGPGGLIINASSGALLWAAAPSQVGTHDVTISVVDGHGGKATQSFKIEVRPARENEPTIFASDPVTKIGTGEKYSYKAIAVDDDNDALRYRLLEGPNGATINPATGELTWDGRTQALTFGQNGSSGDIIVHTYGL